MPSPKSTQHRAEALTLLPSPSSPTREASPKEDILQQLGLPPSNTVRWDTRRKAQVVTAVRTGHLSLEEACTIYAMSVDEFLSWQSLLERFGTQGLMATRVKEYRTKRMAG